MKSEANSGYKIDLSIVTAKKGNLNKVQLRNIFEICSSDRL